MRYLFITAGVFLLDFGVKHYMDRTYARKVKHLRLGGRLVIEKYYNEGAALNFLAKRPKVIKKIQTGLFLLTSLFFGRLLCAEGRQTGKLGMAFLTGGGLSNLYDRYTYGYVIDYFRINIGSKRLGRIIFNISDFFIFVGAFLAAVGSEDWRRG